MMTIRGEIYKKVQLTNEKTIRSLTRSYSLKYMRIVRQENDHHVLILDFKEPGVNVNAERYANTVKRLRVNIILARCHVAQTI